MSVLETRKKKIGKDITDRFKKLNNFIKRAEELTLKKLEETASKAEEKIRGALQMDKKMVK